MRSLIRKRLHDLLQAQSIDSSMPLRAPRSQPDDILRLKVKARLQRVGREMKLVVHNPDDQAQADPG
jgi:site-specific DNA recombinase